MQMENGTVVDVFWCIFYDFSKSKKTPFLRLRFYDLQRNGTIFGCILCVDLCTYIPSSSNQLKQSQLARRHGVFGYPKQSPTDSVGSVLKWRARSRRHAVNSVEYVVDEHPTII
jgi:hypothetical protein